MAVCPTCRTAYDAGVRICPADGTVLAGGEPPPDPHLGSMLESKYRIDAFISAGGMGSVYRGTHVMLDKTVAIKLIRRELVTTPDVSARFQREARAASSLSHTNIAAVSDFGQTADGTLYLVMEFIAGSSLRDVIRDGGPMPPDRIVAILQPIASALARAHRQHIVHRDLKPHNVMLAIEADGTITPKLLDFGIAKTFDESASQLTMTGFALGTPQYMSPEQAMGKVVDARSDIYSLGIVLYEMLTGEVPFNDASLTGVLLKQMTEAPVAPSARRPDLVVSPALERIALRCLEKDPANRFQTAEDLLDALEHAKSEPVLPAATLPPRPIPGSTSGATLVTPHSAAGSIPPIPAVPPSPPSGAAASPPPIPPRVPGTSPTIPAPPQNGMAQPGPTRRSSGALWIPAVALAALVLLVIGVRGLRPSSSPDAGSSSSSTSTSAEPAPIATTPASGTNPQPVTSEPQPASASTARESSSPPSSERPAAVTPPPAPVTTSQTQDASTRGATSEPAAPAVPPRRPAASTSSLASNQAVVPAPPAAPPTGTGGTTTPARPPSVPAAQQVPARTENPSVFVQCTGPGEVCGPMRAAFGDAAMRDGMTLASSRSRADVVLLVEIEILEERVNRSFGTALVTRTYSAQVDGESAGAVVPMPAGRTFSFDATVGRERAAENARLLAADVIEKVRAFWRK